MAMMRRHGLQSFGLTQRRVPAGPASLKLPFGVGSVAARTCSRGRILPRPPPPEAVVIPSAHFRVLLLRHPGVALTRSGITGRLAPPPASLQHVRSRFARVCREAGAAAARNVRVADMNIDVPVDR